MVCKRKSGYIESNNALRAFRFTATFTPSPVMRQRFEAQLTLGCTPIEEVKIPTKTRSHLAALLAALQYIYLTPEWNRRIFGLLSEQLVKGKQKTGRPGMSLWELFVLGQVRLCMNTSYDELHFMANDSEMLRGIMGVLPSDYSLGKQYQYQQIYDNVKLLDETLLRQLNAVIVQVGHQVFKKKSRALAKKVAHILIHQQAKTLTEAARLEQLAYYYTMLVKHIDLVHRRLVNQETIPHGEKVFSIFQPYTEMIKKGKQHPNIWQSTGSWPNTKPTINSP